MKLLFTDIDGTLIRRDQTISDPVAVALSEAAGLGHGLILSSGRPLKSIETVFSYLDTRLTRPFSLQMIIANNGAQIYDRLTGKDLYERRLPLFLVDALQALAEECGIHIQTYTDDNLICTRMDAETERYVKRVILPIRLSPRLSDALDRPPFKMLALSNEGSEALMPFRKAALERFGDHIHCIFSGEGYLEIINRQADKGNALRFLAEHLQLPISDTFAAGDSENDLPMILAAGTGYAMANATEPVKAAAPYITLHSNEEDGILEVLEPFLR
ncbi:MAG: HAD family hydrolase [Lachnospiraceae bacterium]|nr:HAD family hydrolase [Lachnospiraceae bacterium]